MSINWEQLTVSRLFNGDSEEIPRSTLFMRMGSAFRRPKEELRFILGHLEKRGHVEKFRIGNGDYFYRRKVSSEPIFKKGILS